MKSLEMVLTTDNDASKIKSALKSKVRLYSKGYIMEPTLIIAIVAGVIVLVVLVVVVARLVQRLNKK